MTRVLMTADTVGGVWTYALELADALQPHGVEVHLATMGRRLSPYQREQVDRSAVVQVHESDYALEWMPDPWPDVEWSGEWLLELAHELQPDVVHLNGYVHASLPWQAPVVVVAHSDVLSWWRAVHQTSAPAEWARYRDAVAAGLAAADAVVAPTAAVLSDLQASFGFTGGRVIANCRRGDWVRRVAKEPLVLASGRAWDEAKGLSSLASVANRLPWPVRIAGDDADLGQLPFDELAQWLLRASVFVSPALYEPFGLGILEAALAGCALVLGDIPSLREVWADAAVYVPPRDTDAVVAALTALAADPARVVELRERARERAGRYTPERAGTSYAKLYSHLPVRVRAS